MKKLPLPSELVDRVEYVNQLSASRLHLHRFWKVFLIRSWRKKYFSLDFQKNFPFDFKWYVNQLLFLTKSYFKLNFKQYFSLDFEEYFSLDFKSISH